MGVRRAKIRPSITSHQIRICICGQPVRPNIGGVRAGRSGAEAQSSVMDSIEGAMKSRTEIPQLLAALANDMVPRTEQDVVTARIAELEAKMEALVLLGEPAASETKDPTPAKPRKAGK